LKVKGSVRLSVNFYDAYKAFTHIGYSGRMDQSSISQNRQSRRSPVLLSAQIVIEGADTAVVLRNLSATGALIEGAKLPPVDTETTFKRKDLEVSGRIAWVHGKFAGLAFDRQLEPAELLRQVPKPKQRFEQQYRRPGLTCEPLSAADRKMLEMWATSAPLARLGD